MIKQKFNYFLQNRLVKNVATLQVGSFGGTLVQAVSGIFIARLLQPELFGVYSLAIGLASLAGLLLGAGMQDAVATLVSSSYTRNDREGLREALAYLLKITFYAGLVTLVIFLFMPSLASRFYDNPLIGWYAGIVILGVFISTSFNAVVQLSLQVAGRIRLLALIVFSDQFLRSGFSLLLVFFGFGVLGGVSGQFIGATAVFLFSVFVWTRLGKLYDIFPSVSVLLGNIRKVSLKKYFGFSLWVAIDRNIGNLYMTLPVVLTGIYVSTGEVAFFKLAFGYLNLALSLLGPVSVLLNMEFPKIQVEEPQKLRSNFIRISLLGLMTSLVLTLGAIVVSPLAFRILYGESFVPSVSYVFGLVIYGALFGIGVGLGPMWRAINRVKVSIMINLIILGAGVPLGLLMIRQWGLWGAVVMTTIWFSISHLISFIYLLRHLNERRVI